ncbi:hypothetical protein LTR09_009515 [Extremus antarcticus]|uniref:Uncharacterized protein n=1 Tax=Extremus antarcticus TaxID=702011 RepID=A0AAJ0D8J4_9PEZI|nr:hypothetical protein LTR09_009515 [Extremus antarcticus]
MPVLPQFEGYTLEVVLTTANAAAQAWYGYEQGIIAGILVSERFLDTFPSVRNPVMQGTFTSIFSVNICTIARVLYIADQSSLEISSAAL